MKRYFISLFLVSLIVTTFFSCNKSKKVDDLKEEVTRLAGEVDKAFVTTRNNILIRKKIVEEAYNNIDTYDLSIDKMDVENGGIYTWLEDYTYYPTEDKFNGKGLVHWWQSAGMYLDKQYEFKPENFKYAEKLALDDPRVDEVKKEMRLYEEILEKVMDAGEDVGYNEYTYLCNPRYFLHMPSIYFDIASALGSTVTLEMIAQSEWLINGTPYGNPDNQPLWTGDVAVGMGGEGYLQTVAIPVYKSDKTYVGFLNQNLYPMEIAEKNFKNNENLVLFLSSSTAIMGLSNSAKELLEVKELKDFDYLEQMAQNAFVEDEFKLIHESQKDFTQEIGKKILAGEKEFEQDINGKKYTVIIKDIPEVNFFVAGLIEK